MKHLEHAMECYGRSRLYHREWLEHVFKFGGHNFPISSNWCAVFIDYVCKMSDYERPSKPAAARNWLKVGLAVTKPRLGDLVVFWREAPESWKGHVGIYIGEDIEGRIFLLGGNQGPGRSVIVQRYSKERLLGYRRLLEE